MSLNELMLIIKARRNIILKVFFGILLLGTIISFMMPRTYESTASLLLNYSGVDPVTGKTLPSHIMPGYMATQIDVIQSENVALRVVDQLKLADIKSNQEAFRKISSDGDIRLWLAQNLLRGLIVRPSKKSSVIEIVYRGTDPKYIASVANAFSQAYEAVNLELKVQPAQKAAAFLDQQTETLRKNLEAAQSNLSQYQKAHGITSLNKGLDIEIAKLNELSSQMVAAQGQLFDSNSRNNNASNNAPDIAASPLVQDLKAKVATAKAKLTELSEIYGPRHPKYVAAEAELNEQRRLLNNEISNARGNVRETYNIYKKREAEIEEALAAQKAKVLQLNVGRDELTILENAVENAEQAMDIASQRYNATLQEASSNQSDLSVLSVAKVPFLPSSPKVKLNILISMFLGLILGLMFAIISESRDKRIRSIDDLNKLLGIKAFEIKDVDSSNTQQASSAQIGHAPNMLIEG